MASARACEDRRPPERARRPARPATHGRPSRRRCRAAATSSRGARRPPSTPTPARRPRGPDVTAARSHDPRPCRVGRRRDGRGCRIASCRAGSRTGSAPQSPQSMALRRVGAASQPSAAAPRRITSSFGGTTAAARRRAPLDRRDVGVPLRPVDPVEAVVAAHSARTSAGTSMHVIQFTSVPPPTPAPASIVTAPSHVASSPWLRYRRSYASSSSRGIVASSTNGPASRTTTDRPAARQVRGDDAAARPRADDHDVGFERRSSGEPVSSGERVGADRASSCDVDRRVVGP